ncbi:transglycosylase SLT domain-containing protein [Nocardia sp. NPDC051832]|uniref:transglycosylase SLT domain-containing protein n=1 Tax=Nocardia sp. NPDC051832 TaxID=3155673 RepID=UPI0034305BFE
MNATQSESQWSSAAFAAPALDALASIASSFGQGNPTAQTGTRYVPQSFSASSLAVAHPPAVKGRVEALARVDREWERLLTGAAGATLDGRHLVSSLVAEVNAALTALATVPDSAAAGHRFLGVSDRALRRASEVAERGAVSSRVTSDRVAELSRRYRPDRRTRRRSIAPVAGAGNHGVPLRRPSGSQRQWIDQALKVLRDNGYDTRRIDRAAIAAIIQHESSGNPNAINRWDSNAAAGVPSKGLMQTIDPTFNSYALPGHRNIWNPVDNIVAGVRYAIDRYGSLDNVPGIVRLRQGRSYVGY